MNVKLDQEIRDRIAKLDDQIGRLLEDLIDQDDDGDAAITLKDKLEDLQAAITEWQEEKGYI